MWPFKKKEIILSKRKYSDYLPVGTIIKLYNDDNEYMIYRYLGNSCVAFNSNNKIFQKSYVYNQKNDTKKTYYHADYEIVLYPYGLSPINDMLCIMHEDVKQVIYLGYNDEYRKNAFNDIDKWNEKGEVNE